MNQITTVGVDLAKDLIVACAADGSGRTLFFKQFGFRGFASWAVDLPPCTMEKRYPDRAEDEAGPED